MHAKSGYHKQLFKIVALLATVTGSLGRLTEAPKNSFVLEGATAEFICCSDVHRLLFWKVKPIGSQSTADIYDISGLVNGFRKFGRFNVSDDSRPGCYIFTIRDVKLENAGSYTCIDNEGLGQSLSWELVMLESFDCQETNRRVYYMGENDFDLPQDVISAVCVFKYTGNVPPKPICEWSSGTGLLDNHHRVTEQNLATTLTIQIPAKKKLNRDQLYCYVDNDRESNNNKTPIAWKSSHIMINYASFNQKKVSRCSVDELSLDCQPPCNYMANLFANGSSYCEITYPSRTHRKVYVLLQDNNGQQITFNLETTNMPIASQAQSSGIFPIVTAVIVTVLICCVLAATIALATCIVITRKRKKHERPRRDRLMYATIHPKSDRDMSTTEESFGTIKEWTELLLQPTTVSTPANMNALGRYTISKPDVVLNFGDGTTVTVNDEYGDQQCSVTTQPENAQFHKEMSTTEESSRTILKERKKLLLQPTTVSTPANMNALGVNDLFMKTFNLDFSRDDGFISSSASRSTFKEPTNC